VHPPFLPAHFVSIFYSFFPLEGRNIATGEIQAVAAHQLGRLECEEMGRLQRVEYTDTNLWRTSPQKYLFLLSHFLTPQLSLPWLR